jgi:hypothetical protein
LDTTTSTAGLIVPAAHGWLLAQVLWITGCAPQQRQWLPTTGKGRCHGRLEVSNDCTTSFGL